MKYLSYLLVALLLTGCLSTKNKGRRLIRKGQQKIEKGLRLAPSLADTINKVKTIYIEVPSKSDTVFIIPEIDTALFNIDIKNYDSLLLKANDMQNDINNQIVSGEKREWAMSQLRHTNNRLKELRNEFIAGYSKDSTYIYEDEILIGQIEIKDGILTKFAYITKVDTVQTKVKTTTINIDGRKTIGFGIAKVLGWIVALLVVAGVIILVRKYIIPRI